MVRPFGSVGPQVRGVRRKAKMTDAAARRIAPGSRRPVTGAPGGAHGLGKSAICLARGPHPRARRSDDGGHRDADGCSWTMRSSCSCCAAAAIARPQSRASLAQAPRARLAVLPGTSHIGMLARSQLIVDVVTPFLDDEKPPLPDKLPATRPRQDTRRSAEEAIAGPRRPRREEESSASIRIIVTTQLLPRRERR